MNILYKALACALLLLCAHNHAHIEELEAHVPSSLIQKQDCPLLG